MQRPSQITSTEGGHKGTTLAFLLLPCSWESGVEPNDTYPQVAHRISEERATVTLLRARAQAASMN